MGDGEWERFWVGGDGVMVDEEFQQRRLFAEMSRRYRNDICMNVTLK